MANRFLNKCSASLAVREMQNKADVRAHTAPQWLPPRKPTTDTDEDIYSWWRPENREEYF